MSEPESPEVVDLDAATQLEEGIDGK